MEMRCNDEEESSEREDPRDDGGERAGGRVADRVEVGRDPGPLVAAARTPLLALGVVRPQQHAQTDASSVTAVHNIATRDVNAGHDVWRQGGVSRETKWRRADSQTQDSKGAR